MTRMWKVKVAMSVLIDKSVCPHASGQRTAMHVCDERGRGGAGVRAGWRAQTDLSMRTDMVGFLSSTYS